MCFTIKKSWVVGSLNMVLSRRARVNLVSVSVSLPSGPSHVYTHNNPFKTNHRQNKVYTTVSHLPFVFSSLSRRLTTSSSVVSLHACGLCLFAALPCLSQATHTHTLHTTASLRDTTHSSCPVTLCERQWERERTAPCLLATQEEADALKYRGRWLNGLSE